MNNVQYVLVLGLKQIVHLIKFALRQSLGLNVITIIMMNVWIIALKKNIYNARFVIEFLESKPAINLKAPWLLEYNKIYIVQDTNNTER